MKARTIVLAALLTGCAASAPAPAPLPPSTPPPIMPPPPQRPLLQAVVYGQVREPGSNIPAAHALVTATVASPDCSVPTDRSSQWFAGERGEYELTVEAGVGPDMVTCVTVAATAGGATGSTTIPNVWFRSHSPERYAASVDLDPLPPLTVTEAESLIRSFVEVLNHNSADELRLSTYVRGGPEAFRTAREDYQALLGWNIRAETITVDDLRVRALLRGDRGGPLSFTVYDDDRLRRFHSPLVDYSLRARHFMSSFARTIMANDAERLAHLLTADDIDFPVEEAKRIIEKHRPDFEVMSGQFELTGVDERKNTLTYRETLRGDGGEKELEVVLRYGDGLLSLVEVRDRRSP